MSLLRGFEAVRLVKVGPSLRERLERRIATVHHRAVVGRLRRFRERIERDMEPEPWTALEAPMVIMLADLCDGLGLDEKEKATVLGAEGVLTIGDTLETGIRPVASPWLPTNERQAKAMRYVREHGEVGLNTYRQICPFWSNETLRLDLSDLVKRGLLVKNGRKKGTRYTIPD
jgi:hypothetical protein